MRVRVVVEEWRAVHFVKGVCRLLVVRGYICESINTIVYIVVKKGWRNQAAGCAVKGCRRVSFEKSVVLCEECCWGTIMVY